MPIMKVERPERHSLEDGNRLSEELAKLRAKRVGDAAVQLGSQALTASIQGETVTREGSIMYALGEESPTVVPERTVDNFWLHKPA
jgi:hypothetical protein